MKRWVMITALVCVPGTSMAFDIGLGDWISGQNTVLFEQLATQLKQLTELENTFDAVRKIEQAGNETLSLARVGYQQFTAARNFSLKDAIQDAKWALYRAFPELREIEADAIDIQRQVGAMGEGSFFSYHGRRDDAMYEMLYRLFNFEYQSTIWPLMFDGMERRGGTVQVNPTEIDEEIMRMYMQTGRLKEWARKRTVLGSLTAQANEFVRQAQEKEEKNLKLLAETASTQILSQMLSNSTEFIDLYKYQVAKEEKARRMEQTRRRAIRRSMEKHTRKILTPGALWNDEDDNK